MGFYLISIFSIVTFVPVFTKIASGSLYFWVLGIETSTLNMLTTHTELHLQPLGVIRWLLCSFSRTLWILSLFPSGHSRGCKCAMSSLPVAFYSRSCTGFKWGTECRNQVLGLAVFKLFLSIAVRCLRSRSSCYYPHCKLLGDFT